MRNFSDFINSKIELIQFLWLYRAGIPKMVADYFKCFQRNKR